MSEQLVETNIETQPLITPEKRVFVRSPKVVYKPEDDDPGCNPFKSSFWNWRDFPYFITIVTCIDIGMLTYSIILNKGNSLIIITKLRV